MNKRSRGQTLPYLFIMIMVLVISWSMILNISKLLIDRMTLQNAADNAAISIAVYKARVLNRLGHLNYLMGCVLYGTEWGVLNYHSLGITGGPYGFCAQGPGITNYMRFVDDQQKVACILDAAHGYCSGIDYGHYESHKFIEAIKFTVDTLVNVQKSYRIPYPGLAAVYADKIGRRQEINSKGMECGADQIFPIEGLSLGLKVNENRVKYFATESFCVSDPIFTGTHGHIYWPSDYATSYKSWLYGDGGNFDKSQKIVVIARKSANSPSNEGYPLFKKWIGIQWPEVEAIAAAAVYNKKGAMFPVNEGKPSNRISPVIKEFKKAEHGGWYAHLVPVGGDIVQH